MSQMANIAVYDGAATPVLHTLKPVSVVRENGVTTSIWREEVAGLPDEAQVNAILTERVLRSGVTQREFRVNVPVMESVSGQNAAGYTASPKVAYVDSHVQISYAHPRSTAVGRRLVRMLGVNAANNVITSVAAATTGAVPEAFDSGFMPT